MRCRAEAKSVADIVIQTTNGERRHDERVSNDSIAVNVCPRISELWSCALRATNASSVTAPCSLSPGVLGITRNTRITKLPNAVEGWNHPIPPAIRRRDAPPTPVTPSPKAGRADRRLVTTTGVASLVVPPRPLLESSSHLARQEHQ